MGRPSRLAGWLTLAVALPLAGCGDDSFVMPKIDTTPRFFSISGIITELTPQGVRPSVGAGVGGLGANVGTVGDYRIPYAITDGQGRYAFSDVRSGEPVQLQISKNGYFQQCAVPEIIVGGGNLSLLDGQLVAAEVVSALPASAPTQRLGYRFVTGTVYRAGGREPAAGMRVVYGSDDHAIAVTRTDAMGRYMLCGLPEKSSVGIEAVGLDTGAELSVPAGPSVTGADLTFWR